MKKQQRDQLLQLLKNRFAEHKHRLRRGAEQRVAAAWRVRYKVLQLGRTPKDIRALGGALSCDRRYGKVFVYHNGAQSYCAARGFRGMLRV